MGTAWTQTGWVDWTNVIESVGGDLTTLRELVTLFQDAMPRHQAAIRKALTKDDWETIAHESHAMKGQIAFFTQGEPFQTARQVVNTARASENEACRDACQRLDILVNLLTTEIEEGLKDRENPDRG